jgi:hypothetical protein
MLAFITMLVKTFNNVQLEDFADALRRYIGETLHAQIRVHPLMDTGNLPSFLTQSYAFFEAKIAARRCIFVVANEKLETPMNIAKHMSLVRPLMDGIVVFATSALSAHNRARLIAQAVSFVVPGNQLYIPELAMNLREHFRATKVRHQEGLSPAAQVVLFHHLLHHKAHSEIPSILADRLHYSAMSIGRAFDDLATKGLAIAQKRGRERYLHFLEEPRDLFKNAIPLLKSPVRRVRFVQGAASHLHLKLAGESAIAKLTDLNPPEITTYALSASDWKTTAREHDLREIEEFEADFSVETWSYDPGALSDDGVVDPLSLFAQFQNHPDERLAGAAAQLLENIHW